MSCATHRLDGGIPLALEIIDSDGKLVETITN
jgi:hypothetical protein